MTARQTLALLRRFESPNVTFMDPDGSWPIVWERAKGVYVWDSDGRKYLDLTAAFGVAAAGHANPRVVQAGQRQMARLLHAMGDVHPHPLKARLASELSRITFERWSAVKLQVQSVTRDEQRPARLRSDRDRTTKGKSQKTEGTKAKRETSTAKTIFCNSGFEAVEAALKTAILATGKPGVIAFKGAYHGLGYGALNATHRPFFRFPFQRQLGRFVRFADFPRSESLADLGRISPSLEIVESQVLRLLSKRQVGAVLVEPVQVRGGINIPSPEFLRLLRRACDSHGALLILDEIYTGFGRTGKWFACEHSEIVPDLICLGKALTGGFPLSACVGRAALMDAAWPTSSGEAIHTSTFLGHPVGCAMALAQIAELETRGLIERSAACGKFLLSALADLTSAGSGRRLLARGLGLMAGLEVNVRDGSPDPLLALTAIKSMLQRGFILLPEGDPASVISFTPPLTITEEQITTTVRALRQVLK